MQKEYIIEIVKGTTIGDYFRLTLCDGEFRGYHKKRDALHMIEDIKAAGGDAFYKGTAMIPKDVGSFSLASIKSMRALAC